MPRGGNREGAGRKEGSKELTRLQRTRIAARYEALWAELMEAGAKETLAKGSKATTQQWKRISRIPPSKRRDWLATEEGQEYVGEESGQEKGQGDFYHALREDQGLDADDPGHPSRVRHVKLVRPKGAKAKVEMQVAEEFAVTPRMVRTCVIEYRKFLKETALD